MRGRPAQPSRRLRCGDRRDRLSRRWWSRENRTDLLNHGATRSKLNREKGALLRSLGFRLSVEVKDAAW